MQKNEKQASADSGLLSMDLIPFQSVISKAAKQQQILKDYGINVIFIFSTAGALVVVTV